MMSNKSQTVELYSAPVMFCLNDDAIKQAGNCNKRGNTARVLADDTISQLENQTFSYNDE